MTGFRLVHVGHEVVEGSSDRFSSETRDGTLVAEDGGKVRLLKVLVELVMLPAYSSPVFTITGVKEDLKSAFVQVVSPSQRDQVNETVEKCKYLDSSASDTVYVWDPKSVSFSDDAKLAMSFSSPTVTEPALGREETMQDPGLPTAEVAQLAQSAEAVEIASDLKPIDSGSQSQSPALLVLPAPQSVTAPLPLLEPPAPPIAFSTSPASPAANTELGLEATGSSIESEVASQAVVAEDKPEASAQPGAEAQESKTEDDNYLLVSRTWYIEGGSKNMSEAVRISKLLRPFRWKIEPAYTIGVMVDDILSIETANGEIEGEMTKKVEAAGYSLSRFTVEKGKPVAWFKKSSASG